MIRFLDYHGTAIRDFSQEQLTAHQALMANILSENNFEDTGITELIKNYLSILEKIEVTEAQITEKKFTKNETFLYDLAIEIARLCYKHGYNTECMENFEEEFI